MTDLYLFRNALQDLMRPKRIVAALVLVAMSTFLAVAIRVWGKATPQVTYDTVVGGLVFGFVLVILAVIYGTSAVAQEIEQKTIVYLLTRPVPRWRILLVKFAAAVVVTTLVAWLAAFAVGMVTYGVGGLAQSHFGRDLLVLPLGAMAYGALFLLLATLINRSLMWGLLFAFGWESWVPTLAGNFQKVSLMSYLRVLAPHPTPESETVSFSDILNAINPTEITSRMAWTVLLSVIVIALAFALGIFSVREYAPREDAE